MSKIKPLFMLLLCLVMATVAFGKTYDIKDVPNVHVADRTRYVSNPDGILSDAAVASIDDTLSNVWKQSSAEMVVVVVGSVDGDINDFATRLFEKWGIGKKDKDNGLLMVVSKDDRRMAIRTGYGMEGVLPDILAGRVIRDTAVPYFKEGDYDGGVKASVNEIARIITTPGATEELMSKYANDSADDEDDITASDLFTLWLYMGGFAALVLAAFYLYTIIRTRRLDRYDRYQSLKKLILPGLIVGFIGLGIPMVITLIIWLTMRYMRLRRRRCPNCHSKMRRLDEATDNEYLTPAQDAEERLNSVDYDVWLCDTCGETDILPFVNTAANYTVCQHCGARASSLRSNRVIQTPTEHREGIGVKDYMCRNCGYESHIPYNIPKVVVPPVIITPGIGGRGGGGGGFSGGSFGGGMTGGGGASGGW
jgi:uncharacterized protein